MAFFNLSRLFSRDKPESAGCRFRTTDQSKSERFVPANHESPHQEDFVKIPFGGKVGLTPEQELAAATKWGHRPLWFPDDPRHSHLFTMHFNGDREATTEEAKFYLMLDREHLERAGLTFAEQGDPDAFTVKWKGRARDRERIEAEREAQGVAHA